MKDKIVIVIWLGALIALLIGFYIVDPLVSEKILSQEFLSLEGHADDTASEVVLRYLIIPAGIRFGGYFGPCAMYILIVWMYIRFSIWRMKI